MVYGDPVPRRYRVIDPRSGEVLGKGTREGRAVPDAGGGPRVYICCDELDR